MYVLGALLIIAAFFIGSLWTKVQVLESGVAPTSAKVAGTSVPTQPTPTAPAPPQVGDVDSVTDSDWVRGDRSARIALIEYSDLECPFCQRFHPTAQQAVDEYSGDLMWVYRHFPLDQLHSKADKEAEAVECAGKLAGNDGFWALTDKIFEVSPANNGLDLDTLPDLAAEVGIDRGAFEVCLDSGEMASVVEDSYQSGLKAGVQGTPGNILLNTETGEALLVPGAVPFASLQSSIDQMLAR